MYATTVRGVPSPVKLSERQFSQIRLTGKRGTTIVVNLAPATAAAAGILEDERLVAESVVYDFDASDGWLVGCPTAEMVDGRSHPNAARVLKAGGKSTTVVLGLPKEATEGALGITLAELQDGADVRVAVATAPGVIALRPAGTVDVDVDPSVFEDLDAPLLLEEANEDAGGQADE